MTGRVLRGILQARDVWRNMTPGHSRFTFFGLGAKAVAQMRVHPVLVCPANKR